MKNAKSSINIRKLVGTAMLGAVATILMYLEFPIPIMPPFIKMDVSELPALIAGFAYGPVSGVVVCLIKNLIKLPSTTTAAVGELFNFVMGALFVGTAALVYKKIKSRKGAAIGSVLGAAVMAIVSVPYNYFIVYPAYVVFYGMPLDAIVGTYQAINPGVDGLLACLLMFNLPFTFFKGLVDALICFLIYKPLSPILHGRR
ncbi:MAG: ECF transporter S component [Oscillospiraceae bacterium]